VKNFYFVKTKTNFPKKFEVFYSTDPKKAGKIKKYWRLIEDRNHALL